MTQIYRISRLRLIDQEPTVLEKLILPTQRFPQLDSYDLGRRSLYEILETEYGVKVTQAQQSFEVSTQ